MLQNTDHSKISSYIVRSVPGAAILHKAIEALERTSFYPFDSHLVKLLEISRAVEESDFEVGTSDAKFFQMAASSCNVSVTRLFAAAKDPADSLYTKANYTIAAYSSGKAGIDDALRFFRWRYYSSFDDAAQLQACHPLVDSLRAEAIGEHFLGELWGTHLDNPAKSTLGIIFGPSSDSPSNSSRLDSTDMMIHVGRKVCEWLKLESRFTRLEGHADLSQLLQLRSGTSAFAEITFPESWQWPHRAEEWKLELTK